jgi:hypothetical protein
MVFLVFVGGIRIDRGSSETGWYRGLLGNYLIPQIPSMFTRRAMHQICLGEGGCHEKGVHDEAGGILWVGLCS